MLLLKKRWLLSAICYLLFQTAHTQPVTNSADEQDILKIYEAQLKQGYATRSMSDPEIEKYMTRGNAGISSLEDFAKELNRLFPATISSKIAVLFFVFNKDTLFRFFITPGKVQEQKAIPISKEKLEKLNIDVYNSLNIYNLVANRAPVERGLKPAPKKSTPGLSFDKAIKNATGILLPDSFDARYEHLIVIPSFTIGAFPFQLLQPYKDSSYLIDKCSFSIAPSLLDLIAIRKRLIKKIPVWPMQTRFRFLWKGRFLFLTQAIPPIPNMIFLICPELKKKLPATCHMPEIMFYWKVLRPPRPMYSVISETAMLHTSQHMASPAKKIRRIITFSYWRETKIHFLPHEILWL